MIEQALQDLKYGARILWRSPGLSATVVVLIALVIGGNTTIFSMVHQVFTQPAPGIEANGLVMLGVTSDRGVEDPGISYPNYQDASRLAKTVRPLLAAGGGRFALTVESGSFALFGATVTANYFETLGVSLLKGRTFADEESQGGTGLVAIVSHRVWQTYLHSAEDVIGRSLILNGHPATIVGVAPARFRGTAIAGIHDIWVPLVAYSRIGGTESALMDRSRPSVEIFGRLTPGTTLRQAQMEFARISERLRQTNPDGNRNESLIVAAYSALAFTPAARLAVPIFLAIFSVVTLVTLLIVCANVANLMLGRSAARQREMAVRQSLGASRLRIVSMMVAEGLSLSVTAGLAASAFVWLISGLTQSFIDIDLDLTPDWGIILYAMLLAIASTVLFMLAPAIAAWRQELLPWLKTGEHGIVAGRSRLSNVLAVIQLSFAVVLLTGSGLAWRSLSFIDPDFGFNRNNLVLVTVNTAGSVSTKEANVNLIDQLVRSLNTLDGVTAVSHVRRPPHVFWGEIPVRRDSSQMPVLAGTNSVGPGYLRSIGVSPSVGRDISAEDREDGVRAVVINQNLADALWPGESALGQTLFAGEGKESLQVVGVSPNVFFGSFTGRPKPNFIFDSARQNPAAPGDVTFYLRYEGSTEAVTRAVSTTLKAADSRVPVVSIKTMEQELSQIIRPLSVVTILLSLFAIGSLLTAAVGLYAVIAFSMARRTREFGVRMALGASSRQILMSVVKEGVSLTIRGLLIGFALSAIAGSAVKRLLFGVTPTDGVTYLGVFLLLAAASLLACYFPALRASSVDPSVALRHD